MVISKIWTDLLRLDDGSRHVWTVLARLDGSGTIGPAEGRRSCRSLVLRIRGAEAERSGAGAPDGDSGDSRSVGQLSKNWPIVPRTGQLCPEPDGVQANPPRLLFSELLVGSAEIGAQSSGSDWSS